MTTGGWRVMRLAQLGHFIPGCGFPHEYQGTEDAEIPFLKVGDMGLPENGRGIVRWNNSVSPETARHLGARVAPAGTIVFAKVGAALLSNRRRLLKRPSVFDNNMMGFVCHRDAVPDFLGYALSRVDFARLVNPGPVPSVNEGDLREVVLPVPDVARQRAIADFLDRKTAAIDALIEKKERLLALVDERRHATICSLVTKGVAPAVRMRDSGRDWIGVVPAHWDVARIRHVARLESGHTPSRQHPEYWVPEECTIPWVSLADVWQIREGRMDVIRDTAENVSPLGIANSAARVLPAGTVIVSRTASVGFSAIIAEPMATTQDFVNWICGPRLRPGYLLQVFRAMRDEFRRLTMGSTHQTIYMPDVARFVTPVPPLDEQDAIVEEVARRLKALDALASAATREVELLREYRQALITAAVTGQLGVTSPAADSAPAVSADMIAPGTP